MVSRNTYYNQVMLDKQANEKNKDTNSKNKSRNKTFYSRLNPNFTSTVSAGLSAALTANKI